MLCAPDELPDITIVKVLEESPTKDSQASGAIEKANHMVANQVRVLKLLLLSCNWRPTHRPSESR
eukprot:6481986-Amphidinium_carterae.1